MAAVKKAADATGRKICFIGMSLGFYLEAAAREGRAPFDPTEVITAADMDDYDPNELLIVTTGSQVGVAAGVVSGWRRKRKQKEQRWAAGSRPTQGCRLCQLLLLFIPAAFPVPLPRPAPQAEPRAALSLAARDASHLLKLQSSDLILYSAKVIPGNDTRVMQVRGGHVQEIVEGQGREKGRWSWGEAGTGRTALAKGLAPS